MQLQSQDKGIGALEQLAMPMQTLQFSVTDFPPGRKALTLPICVEFAPFNPSRGGMDSMWRTEVSSAF